MAIGLGVMIGVMPQRGEITNEEKVERKERKARRMGKGQVQVEVEIGVDVVTW